MRRLEQTGDFIAADNPAEGDRVMMRLQAAAKNLRTHPAIGRTGRISGTRELVLADLPYIIAYRVTGQDVQILSILHASQRWPEEI